MINDRIGTSLFKYVREATEMNISNEDILGSLDNCMFLANESFLQKDYESALDMYENVWKGLMSLNYRNERDKEKNTEMMIMFSKLQSRFFALYRRATDYTLRKNLKNKMKVCHFNKLSYLSRIQNEN